MSTITESDWKRALQEEQASADAFDQAPSEFWKTGPEIAKILGVSPSHVSKYIPKTWRTQKFRRMTRCGIRPTLHYELPLAYRASAGGHPHLDPGTPALPAGGMKRAGLSRPVPARSARLKS